jgi:hypothetical protein
MTDPESENCRTIKPEDEESRPTASEIRAVIDELEDGGLYEPGVIFWSCWLHDPEGRPRSSGQAESAGAAMAMAWINYWAPDGLIDIDFDDSNGVFDEVPLTVPVGWRFELTPPAPHSSLPPWILLNSRENSHGSS